MVWSRGTDSPAAGWLDGIELPGSSHGLNGSASVARMADVRAPLEGEAR